MTALIALLLSTLCSCWAAVVVPWLLVAGIAILSLSSIANLSESIAVSIILTAPFVVFFGVFSYISRSFGVLTSKRLMYLGLAASLWLMCQGTHLEMLIARVVNTLDSTTPMSTLVVVACGQMLDCLFLVSFVLLALLLLFELPFAWTRSALGQAAVLPVAAFRLIIFTVLFSLGASLIMERIIYSLIQTS